MQVARRPFNGIPEEHMSNLFAKLHLFNVLPMRPSKFQIKQKQITHMFFWYATERSSYMILHIYTMNNDNI